MKQEGSIEIIRPIEEVFDYTNNHVAEWSLTVVEDQMVEEKPNRIGSTFRCVTEDHGQRMEFLGEVTRYERPYASAIHMTGKQFDIEAEYVFENLGERTRVTQRSTVTPKGFLKVVFFLIGWTMKKATCKALEKELQSLKQKLEEGAGQAASS